MTPPRIDLLWLGQTDPPDWELGTSRACRDQPSEVAAALNDLVKTGRSEAILTWDSRLGQPHPATVAKAVEQPGDLWHAGLALGMGGLPDWLDYVKPTWMLSVDPSIEVEATSWRISLCACLMRSELVRQCGGPDGGFQSISGCSLELGHRYALSGALTRHVPWLLEERRAMAPQALPIEDEVRFLRLRFGRFWSRWAVARALMRGRISARECRRLWALTQARIPDLLPRTGGAEPRETTSVASGPVTILIPTLDRYDYLETLLGQIEAQNVQPIQVLVVDQTAPERRRADLQVRHQGIPLEVVHREEAGQCSSRNVGLQAATGEYILFLDDDDEIPENLVELHLQTLGQFNADVSSGVADEVGSGPLPAGFERRRVSDVFPTNNTMMRRSVLERSGLFDLAYEHGPRADGDLGMRVYLSGALMVLNPEIRVLHHHAPIGGLRAHRARRVTYASSRSRLLDRHLPAVTEIYLAQRYFSHLQVKEALLLRVLGTFVVHGGRLKRLAKILLAAALLPHTLMVVGWRYRRASRLLEDYPQIPCLEKRAGERPTK